MLQGCLGHNAVCGVMRDCLEKSSMTKLTKLWRCPKCGNIHCQPACRKVKYIYV